VPDPRLTKLADVLCRYSLDVGAGDLVLVTGPAHAQPLFVEVVRRITALGAHPWVSAHLDGVRAAMLEEGSDQQLETVTELEWLALEAPRRMLSIWSHPNTRYMTRIPGDRQARYDAARVELTRRFEERISKGELSWCGTQYPWHSEAQEAGMSLAEWEAFVYGAGHLDDDDPVAFWREQSARQARAIELLAGVRELRFVAEDTDLTVGVEGRRWLNADGHENFPDGEVFTSPVETATRGHVSFSFPALQDGRELDGVRLWFEDGRVVREEAAKNARFLTDMLNMDDGARLLGEVAFGMNEEIRESTREVLFDEKIGGTFHVALGFGFTEAGGGNLSGLHWDLVCDLRDGGEVYGDGELIYRDGTFLR
jgi:aminopeptidase